MRLVQLSRESLNFPPPSMALREPNGLLAMGGDLSPARLLNAYHNGIFPWFSPGDPILWWSPDPRAVLDPATFHLSRSMKRFHAHSPREAWGGGRERGREKESQAGSMLSAQSPKRGLSTKP